MQGVPGRLLRHGFLDSVPCSRQKQVCEWLDHVLVGRDLSGTRRCGLSPRDGLPGIPDASVSEAPWKGEGPWHPSSSTTSRESPSRRPGPALPPPPPRPDCTTTLSQKHPLAKGRTCRPVLGEAPSLEDGASPHMHEAADHEQERDKRHAGGLKRRAQQRAS